MRNNCDSCARNMIFSKQKQVFAEDVAQAFFIQSLLTKTTGNIITVDGGNIEASLR